MFILFLIELNEDYREEMVFFLGMYFILVCVCGGGGVYVFIYFKNCLCVFSFRLVFNLKIIFESKY